MNSRNLFFPLQPTFHKILTKEKGIHFETKVGLNQQGSNCSEFGWARENLGPIIGWAKPTFRALLQHKVPK